MIRLLLAIALTTQTCFAQEFVVQPAPASLETLQQRAQEGGAHASIAIEGKGAELSVHYASTSSIDTYVLFLNKDDTTNPRNILFAILPAQEEGVVNIPLSRTRGWVLSDQRYKIYFLATGDTDPIIQDVTLRGRPSLFSGLQQYFLLEQFTPSSYHRLSGYRFYGLSATLLLSVLAIVLMVIALRRKRLHTFSVILLTAILFGNARFSLDALRYTGAHFGEWIKQHTYAHAGSAYEIAEYMKENNIENFRICTDGNSYFPVLMQYAAYPVRRKDGTAYVLVRNAFRWSYADGTLRCGDIEQAANLLETFTDGTELFALTL